MNNNMTVVVNQPQAPPPPPPNTFIINNNNQAPAAVTQPLYGKRDWSGGILGCFDDCTECCFAYWCFPFYVCSLFPRNSENLCSCVFGGLVPLRTKIRTERAIQGSICNDWCIVFFLPFCAAVQMGKEIKYTQPRIQ